MSPNGGGQYMSRGPFPNGPQGGYPMGHPHNMGGGPGPGFSGMPPGMHGRPGISGPGGMGGGGPMVSMHGGQFPVSSASSGHHLGQQQPGMRPVGPVTQVGEHLASLATIVLAPSQVLRGGLRPKCPLFPLEEEEGCLASSPLQSQATPPHRLHPMGQAIVSRPLLHLRQVTMVLRATTAAAAAAKIPNPTSP